MKTRYFQLPRFAMIVLVLMAAVAVSGCTVSTDPADMMPSGEIKHTISTVDPVDEIKEQCVELCEDLLQGGGMYAMNKENGPCLSDNNMDWDVEDWVCDVAHDPRTEEDNDPMNQCMEYQSGLAHHFVEVDTSCNVIRAV